MNFLLDHDVPIEAARLLRREGHPARQSECAHLLQLLRGAGDSGITGNVNFA